MERTDQDAFASRITTTESARIQRRMRDIATSAARDANLGQKIRAAFENANVVFRFCVGAGDGGKKTSCAAADDNDPFRHSLDHVDSHLAQSARELACIPDRERVTIVIEINPRFPGAARANFLSPNS